MARIKIVLNDRYQHLEGFIEDLPLKFMQSGEVIYSGRNLLKIFEVAGITINVKSFKKPLWINRFVYANLRKSKAKRSYLYASMIKERGFNTPDPIAYVELKVCNLLTYSLYICIHEEFDGIMRELQTGVMEGREDLLRQFAEYTAALHEQKILHLDYSSGNILYKKDGEEYVFYLVDLNRMKFDKTINIDTACFNFRRLWGSDEMIAFFVKEYAKARNFDETACLNKTFEYRKRFWNNHAKQYPDVSPYWG